MQSQDNERTSNRPSFENYRDPKSLGRKSNKVTSILKCEAHHHQINVSYILSFVKSVEIISFSIIINLIFSPFKLNVSLEITAKREEN